MPRWVVDAVGEVDFVREEVRLSRGERDDRGLLDLGLRQYALYVHSFRPKQGTADGVLVEEEDLDPSRLRDGLVDVGLDGLEAVHLDLATLPSTPAW